MRRLYLLLLLTAVILVTGCAQNPKQEAKTQNNPVLQAEKSTPKVTFIELGSVRCIPCQQMQPIMKSVEEKFGHQVKVVFYDVWTTAGQPYADKYNIKLIPTQVFLDEKGEEYFRHEGFFPEDELIKVLKLKGVK